MELINNADSHIMIIKVKRIGRITKYNGFDVTQLKQSLNNGNYTYSEKHVNSNQLETAIPPN